MKKSGLAIMFVVMSINMGLWWFLNRPASPEQDWQGIIKGVSFSPYQAGQNPLVGSHPSPDEIRSDLRLLKDFAKQVRTYGSTEGLEIVPKLAAEIGMTVMAGAWIGLDKQRNQLEIQNLITNANTHGNVNRLIVGNEALLRGEVTVAELRTYLRQVRKQTKKPVSTAETWHVWLDHPDLAEDVDFIAVHILPYWEKIPADKATQWLMERYEQVVKAFPGKPVLLAEVGWPSRGERNAGAKPSQASQAAFLRQFLPLAQDRGIDYFVIEAFDQPWKHSMEGIVGGHWGLFDIYRQPKISWTGPIATSTTWTVEWMVSGFFGFTLISLYLLVRRGRPWPARLLFAVLLQIVMSVLVWYAAAPVGAQYNPLELLAWLVLFPLNIALLATILINGLEMEELLPLNGLKRLFKTSPPSSQTPLPKVSIHVAMCNEPVEMVKQTLYSLSELDYPDFEVLVVDNNTCDPALWRPVRDYCRLLGPRFRFFHLRKSAGFKAGALNFALRHTHPQAQVVGVVDSDYIVRPDWLKTLVPFFADKTLALVQAPQDHRQWQGNVFKEMCNWEYAGFFQIGMVHRNERNAIIQHGTMTLVRHEAMQEVGGWSQWCICEDAELGLRLMQRGHVSVYVPESFGWGLTPDSFSGYCKQRFRWAYGAMQILKRHWRSLLPWDKETRLSMGQRYHFLGGWLPWFTDGIHLLCVCASLAWALGMILVPHWVGTPMSLFLLPILASFGFRLLHFIWLYAVRVRCGLWRTLGAALAGTALVHTIGKAMLLGLFTSDKPFLRTPKCESKCGILRDLLMVKEEALIGTLLWLTAMTLYKDRGFEDADINLWMAVLLVQSVPYIAAVVLSLANSLPILAPAQLLPRSGPVQRMPQGELSQALTAMTRLQPRTKPPLITHVGLGPKGKIG